MVGLGRSKTMIAFVMFAACGGRGGVDAAPAAGNDGLIWIESTAGGGNVDASFVTGHTSCTSLGSSGSCEECPRFPATTAMHSAGTIKILGAAVPVTMMPMGDEYLGFGTDQALFDGGETLTVAASGSDVPAFVKSVIAPGTATITSPLIPSGTSPAVPITRSAGFPVSWTGGSGKVKVSLSGGSSDTTSVICKFDASAGTGTVPADALMVLPYGSGNLWVDTVTDTSVTAGDWGVAIEADHELFNEPTDVE
jgi:hypothetical protein